MQKGIFTNKLTLNIPKKVFLFGVFVGILYATVLYFFLVGCRETWRVVSLLPYQENFVFLSDTEIIFYNFFFALFSCFTGFGVANDFWWRAAQVSNYVRISIIVDQKGLQWFFNHVFFKLATFFGIFCGSISLFEEFHFYPDYKYLFYLLAFALFFHQWMKARLFFGRRILKYMLVAGLIELALSLFLSFIPVHFCQRVNEVLLRQTPRFYCSYELPDSRIAYGILRKSISFPLHIGFSKQQKDSTILVAYSNNRINPLRINNISKWVSENRASMDEMEYEQLTTELSIDKHAKMREVKRVMFQLRKSDARLIYFMVNKFGVGLPIRLRPICREILKADTSNQTINIPCSDVKSYRSKNTVVLEILNDKVFYQNEAIDNSVTDSIKSSIAKFKGDLQFDVFVDDTSQYKTFVYLLENIRLAYHQVWLNLAKERYGLTLSANDLAPNDYNLDLPEEIKEIKREYAINFFIWSDEEIEYFKLKPQK